ncbi:hypothetical protein BDA99DRAFT_487023 [Phascolomyces articulosus]|uniref:Anaphase-promoting complex subunit 1 n=1 Tax=Phascolomyces articulosus TaxID=60185 RepID=A0AAD5K230_9FUNG|nr:hypothetical protein BDA99DRAFT_487023 [Phascolomyces articulosus]
MLKSIWDFTPCGREIAARNPHLVVESSGMQQTDFSHFSKGTNRLKIKPKESAYTLYAVDERPSKDMFQQEGDHRLPPLLQSNNNNSSSSNKSKSNKRHVLNPAMHLEEELYIEGSTVMWSRGGHLVKSFKYEMEKQPVELAIFAWFPFERVNTNDFTGPVYAAVDQREGDGMDDEDEDDEFNANDNVDLLKKILRQHSNIFSIAASNPPPSSRLGKRKRADHLLTKQQEKKDRQKGSLRDRTILRKALCIILRDTVKIHFEDGTMYSVHLPFPVQNACSLNVGLLLEPKRGELVTDDHGITFISITDPAKEAEWVTKAEDANDISLLSFSFDNKPIQPAAHELVFATTVEDYATKQQRQQLVITYNDKKCSHSIWLYSDQKDRILPYKKRKPAFHNSLPAPKAKGKQRKNLTSPSPMATTPPPLSRKDSFVQFHEDFSSDTDQLYGSEAGDSFTESTDTAGLYLHLLYEEKPTRRKGQRQSSVFVAHDTDGSEIICIMKKKEGLLLCVSVPQLLQRRTDPLIARIAASHAVPVVSRKGLKEIIIVRDNKLQLVGDIRQQLLIPLVIPQYLHDERIPNTIADLRNSVVCRFNIVSTDGKIRRCQVDLTPESGMVLNGLAALACALSIQKYGLFRKRFIEYCFTAIQNNTIIGRSREDIEWEAFVISLLSFFPLQTNEDVMDVSMDQQQSPPQPKVRLPPKLRALVQASMDPTPQATIKVRSLVTRAIELSEKDAKEGDGQATDFLNESDNIIRYLHLQYEDYHVSKVKRQAMLQDIGLLLVLLCTLLRKKAWIKYYTIHGFDLGPLDNVIQLTSPFTHTSRRYIDPPDIINTLYYFPPTTENPTKLDEVFGVTRIDPPLSNNQQHSYGRTIKMVWMLYEALGTRGGEKMVMRMVEEGIYRREIEDIDNFIARPLLDVLESYCEKPLMTWTPEHYRAIDRHDMAEQISIVSTVVDPNAEKFCLPIQKSKKNTQDTEHTISFDSDKLNTDTENLRFGYTGVLETVRTSLDSTRVPEIVVPDRPDLADEEVTAEHQVHVMNLIQRTLALSVGRGLYSYGTYKPDLTKAFPIETINLSAKLLPLRTVVAADDRAWSQDYLNWAQFHNGVAAGLRISPSHKVNGSWIVFSNPDELKPEHGGFLLALGLNGNLKHLPLIHWYRYMTQNCELATAGFVLGAAAAYRGTKDSKVTKLLSVHIPALLPEESTTLRHSVLIQATCLLSIGLVYIGSCDRLMSSVMVSEIGRHAYADSSMMDSDFESCALAAGFALGYITLGSGGETPSLADLQIKDMLHQLMTGQVRGAPPRDPLGSGGNGSGTGGTGNDPGGVNAGGKQQQRFINLDVTSVAATIALGLMYLKTENARIAEQIDVLETRPYLNYIRPDFLLVRVVAKNLIMWNTIRPTDAWIEQQLPPFMRKDHPDQQQQQQEDWQMEASKQAMYNIIAGACLCIGLRYAGSDNQEAFRCLLSRLDSFIKMSNTTAVSFQEHITKNAVKTAVDVVATAAAMVVAGTGNLELLERLKQLHSRIHGNVNYGNHMAAHMAMGLLFAGLGGYTLKTTNEAIAGLLTAFYPFYPISPDDNRYSLQAFRHLWTLALDVRWLTPFDVDTVKPCRVPLRLTVYKDEPWLPENERQVKEIRVIAPTVMPTYTLVKSIQLDSPRYLPICVQMDDAGTYQKSVLDSGILCIQRRPSRMTHDEFPDDNSFYKSLQELHL